MKHSAQLFICLAMAASLSFLSAPSSAETKNAAIHDVHGLRLPFETNNTRGLSSSTLPQSNNWSLKNNNQPNSEYDEFDDADSAPSAEPELYRLDAKD